MNVAEVARALMRRWYLTLAGLGLTAVLCLIPVFAVGPTYQDKATVLLLPPESSLTDGENPYLGLSGLQQMVDVLVRSMNAQSTQLEVQQSWPQGKFTIEQDAETSAPVIVITVDDHSSEDAQALTTHLVDLLPTNLVKLQSELGVRERSRITSSVLTRYDKPEAVHSGQLRMGLALAAAGIAGTVLAVGLIDALIVSRRRHSKAFSAEVDLEQPAAVELTPAVEPTPAVELDPISAAATDRPTPFEPAKKRSASVRNHQPAQGATDDIDDRESVDISR